MTLNEVSKQAGVALVTARKALNNDPSVRPHLRRRVLAAAEKLDYHPNLIASGLRRGNTSLAPFSVIGIGNYWNGVLSQNIALKLVKSGLEPVLCYDAGHMLRVCK